MRSHVFPILLLALAPLAPLDAQTTQARTREFDGSGNPAATTSVTEVKTGNSITRTELGSTLNGVAAPRAKVEERVVREDASGRVIERVIRRYDQDGNQTPPEKTLIEEQKDASGAVVAAKQSIYRTDLNGNLQLTERATTQTSKSGNTTTSSIQVDRVAADGALRPAERTTTVVQTAPGSAKENSVTYRPDTNGNFVEAARQVVDTTTAAGKSTENRAQYVDGVLVQQEVATSVSRPDGSKVTNVNVFAQQARGIAAPADGKLVLKEQQTIESKVVPTGIVETVTSRVVSVNEGGRLGEPRKVSETVCTGCKPKDGDTAQPAAPAATPASSAVK